MSLPVYETVQQYVTAARWVTSRILKLSQIARRSRVGEEHPVRQYWHNTVSQCRLERQHYMRQARMLKAMQEAVREARSCHAAVALILRMGWDSTAWAGRRDRAMRRAWRLKAKMLAARVGDQ